MLSFAARAILQRAVSQVRQHTIVFTVLPDFSFASACATDAFIGSTADPSTQSCHAHDAKQPSEISFIFLPAERWHCQGMSDCCSISATTGASCDLHESVYLTNVSYILLCAIDRMCAPWLGTRCWRCALTTKSTKLKVWACAKYTLAVELVRTTLFC